MDFAWRPAARRKNGAGGGSRTHTALRPTDFESAASAIPPLRLALDSTRHATLAKALLAGRSLTTLRRKRQSRSIHRPLISPCPAIPISQPTRIQIQHPPALGRGIR